MTILYLCEEYPPGKNGGIGTMVQVLGRSMVKQGHNVLVVGLYPHGYGQADYEEDEGVKVWRLRHKTDTGLITNSYSIKNKALRKLLKYSGVLHWDTRHSAKMLFNFIEKIIEQHQVDIIEVPDWNTFLHNSFSVLSIPAFKIPLTVKLHGSYSYLDNEIGKPINKRIFEAEKKLLHRANAVSSVSFYTADRCKKLFGYTKEIGILHNSINLPQQNSDAVTDNKIIFTGALVKTKGVHSLLSAWNIVSPKMPSLTLHLYGKGPVDELKKMIDDEVLPTVVFHGHVARYILLEELATATITVFPSYSECFSMAPLEAMAAGCPVIYTSKSSGPELITHLQNGLLVDPEDATTIASALLMLIKNKDLRTEIARAGKELVAEKFNVDKSALKHVDFYQRVIADFNSKVN